MMMRKPMVNSCHSTSSPASASPLRKKPTISAPISVPMIDPRPPNRLVPPMTTAVMLSRLVMAPPSGLIAPIAGHVGDGNFHTQPLLDLGDPEEVARVQGFIDRLVKRALAMGGTCTGEHGVGQKKIKYLELEHGAEAMAVMRTIKRALDPQNILNPGKIVVM